MTYYKGDSRSDKKGQVWSGRLTKRGFNNGAFNRRGKGSLSHLSQTIKGIVQKAHPIIPGYFKEGELSRFILYVVFAKPVEPSPAESLSSVGSIVSNYGTEEARRGEERGDLIWEEIQFLYVYKLR